MESEEYNIYLTNCTVLGGVGLGCVEGETINLELSNQNFKGSNSQESVFEVSTIELAEIIISGPGSTKTGGGFIGGGFGAINAMEGIALAGILNALTTKTRIHTFITFITNIGELHVHYGELEPGALRIVLSPIFATIRLNDPVWIAAREAVLNRKLGMGLIDESHHKALKSRLNIGRTLESEARMGRCPSCRERLPLIALTCIKCRANFGPGSAWRVLP